MNKGGSFNLFNLNPFSEVQKGINKLTKLALKYKTNKTPQLGHSYIDFYYDMFSDKTGDVKKVLQIGLGDKEKNSLYFWQDFFPEAKVYGIGNNEKYVFKRNRIQTFLCGRTNSSGLKNLIDKIGSDIDLVIDEGIRSPNDITSSFQTIMPLLKKDAIYVIENTDGQQATAITDNLKNYNYNVIRHHKMISRYDRLIVVKNKIA